MRLRVGSGKDSRGSEMFSESLNPLLDLLRESCTPNEWSNGVQFARTAEFLLLESQGTGDLEIRVISGVRGTSVKVTLSSDSESWQCECPESDPCKHVIGSAIALTQGKYRGGDKPAMDSNIFELVHELSDNQGMLAYSRYAKRNGEIFPITSSIRAFTEHIKIRYGPRAQLVAGKDDEAIDFVLEKGPWNSLSVQKIKLLVPVLARLGRVYFEGKALSVDREPLASVLLVEDDSSGLKVSLSYSKDLERTFSNGAGIADGVLYALDTDQFSRDELVRFTSGAFVPHEKIPAFFSEVLPRLEQKIDVVNRSTVSIQQVKAQPRVELQVVRDGDSAAMVVIPRIFYGDPAIAVLEGDVLRLLSSTQIPIRERDTESHLLNKIQRELQIKPGVATTFYGEQVPHFLMCSKSWNLSGMEKQKSNDLIPGLDTDASFFFEEEGSGRKISFEKVYGDWSRGARFTELPDKTWAVIPHEWLSKHGERVREFMALRNAGTKPEAATVHLASELCEELDLEAPEYIQEFRTRLYDLEKLPEFKAPEGFSCQLREYQELGVCWLSQRLDLGFGALLADDMGLGKTVQAIAVIRKKTLVIAPTSVLPAWREQIRAFRPDLKVNVYHGAARELDLSVDVVLTSYAIVRLDSEKLNANEWDLIILDESQNIKNPDSQIARCVSDLKSRSKIALSGTPVENDPRDLWSLFRFLNPGLLGMRRNFEARYRGEGASLASLRKLVKPFILRRLKSEVARELPEKTEIVLQVELSTAERNLYNTLLASSRADILKLLGERGSVMSMLEALLRLRQACCHTSLVPDSGIEISSKVELLMEEIERGKEQGHRALVFSQWTALLDLIEPEFTARGIRFSRLDGATKDRARIVAEFQEASGPDVMLLSLKAGGVGITLTAADNVYIVDPWWNPFVEEQASDRAHRIGQRNPVTVYRLVSADTIEEKVLNLQKAKRKTFQDLLDGAGDVRVSREELVELLG